MIDSSRLLADLQRLLRQLHSDVTCRIQENESIGAPLREQYEAAKAASRTAQAYEVWRDNYITQVAVAWILGCVFIRFLEDNSLIETAWLSGPAERLQLARDQHTLYFQHNPSHSDREYLEYVFDEIAKLPSMRELLDGKHNPSTKLGPTGDGVKLLLEFWQKIDPETGTLIHDFTDPEWNTRFLGDLYQDLSETARERYALLQTPEFVEEFILDRTLTPAVAEFGYAAVRMIDPACGSGHFLLGGFRRILDLRLHNQPAVAVRAQVQTVLDQIFGVDVNPYAVAIAQFRLLIAALQMCGVRKVSDAPAFKINVATGDSLLHGPSPRGMVGVQSHLTDDPLQHFYEIEDAESVRQILCSRYHVVVGNPPYIVARDAALNRAYRARFGTCYRKYSLAVPFKERFFDLAVQSTGEDSPNSAGFLGMITANSFMKREFGKNLVEQFLPKWDLTHVVDTSGAHIPGHNAPGEGTTTVILLARARPPMLPTIRTVMGIRGEPVIPVDAAQGVVWTAITQQLDRPGSESIYVSVRDIDRDNFSCHPWNIGGGGAAELKEAIEEAAESSLEQHIESIGFGVVLGDDDAFGRPTHNVSLRSLDPKLILPLVDGQSVRNWVCCSREEVLFPYSDNLDLLPENLVKRWLWPLRTYLWARPDFSKKTYRERGRPYWEYHQIPRYRNTVPLHIVLGEIASHNHFALAEGKFVFNRTAPIITLSVDRGRDQYIEFLGLLNSSVACFWGRQTLFPKGGFAAGKWEERLVWGGTKLLRFPIPKSGPTELAQVAVRCAALIQSNLPEVRFLKVTPTRELVEDAQQIVRSNSRMLVALQEEIDWQCYWIYGLLPDDLSVALDQMPPIEPGERAFEIGMAKDMLEGQAGDEEWFSRHNYKKTTVYPDGWSSAYRSAIDKRLEIIKNNHDISLIERPECKRRWNADDWNQQVRSALRQWLSCRIENCSCWERLELISCSRLADALSLDSEFVQVAEIYLDRRDVDCSSLILDLVSAESVPLLSVLRYTDSGLRKRAIWEQVWDTQRLEDFAAKRVGEATQDRSASQNEMEVQMAVPPTFDAEDFRNQGVWALRGKLDLPKERFVSFPNCERDVDPTPVIGWAGWDHLQLARAIAAYYEQVKNQEGWTRERRIPLLAGVLELLPWLKQWHNDIHPEFQERMGDFFEQFVEDEAHTMEMTAEQIRSWTPPAQVGRRRRRQSS